MNGAILRGPNQTESSMSIARPPSVTFIAWMLLAFAIIGTGLAIYLFLTTDFGRDGTTAILTMFGAVSLLQVVMAVGILSGANWARILFLCLTPVDVAIGLLSGGLSPGLMFKAAYFVVFAFFLTRPGATGFFQAAKGRDRLAYGFAAGWLVLGTVAIFLPQITAWAEKTYRIGYVRHDIASLKLLSDWEEVPAERPVPETWYVAAGRVGLEAIAWAGLRATQGPRLDAESGEVSSFDNREAFAFQPGYVRDSGDLVPCGLTRFHLTFESDVRDPMREILIAQLQANGDTFKHQYVWEKEFRVVEIDVVAGGARFIVWNWWRASEPHQVYGMILGMRKDDIGHGDACAIAGIVSSLEFERSDGSILQAGELETRDDPSMTPVSALLVRIDFERLRGQGLDGSEFFAWLEGQLHAPGVQQNPESVRNLSFDMSNNQRVTLADLASVNLIGRANDDPPNPLSLVLIELRTNCRPQKQELRSIEAALRSVTELSVSIKPDC